MKKNLFGFIGSIVSLFSIFVLFLPAYTVVSPSIYSKSETIGVTFNNVIGVLSKDTSSTIIRVVTGDFTGWFYIIGVILSLVSLSVIIGNIVANKRNSLPVLCISVINLILSMIIVAQMSSLSLLSSESSTGTKYSVGGGSVLLFIIYLATFGLILGQFIADCVAIRSEGNAKSIENLYKYKKLFDDGIISQKEYEALKKENI